VEFRPEGRAVDFVSHVSGELQLLPEGRPVRHAAAARSEGGVAVLASSGEADLFAAYLPAPVEEDFPAAEPPPPPSVADLSPALRGGRVTAVALSDAADEGVAGTERGELLPLRFEEGVPQPDELVSVDSDSVTAAAFLLGGQTVAVGDRAGRVSSWTRVRSADNANLRLYQRIHGFDPMPATVSQIVPSTRNKGFVTGDARGNLWVRHNTSGQTRLRLAGDGTPLVDAGLDPANNGVFGLSRSGHLRSFAMRDPHPEVTWKTLFGKVWYEGYERPEFVWQSTGGTDDFEPKLSLTPLVFGTFKATFYALVFAIPVAIAAALYAALFAHRGVRQVVKPTVEIMAALPSVVIGFLAGLWLAPLVERTTVGTLLMLPAIPLLVVASAILFRAAPSRWRRRLHPKLEVLLLFGLVAAAIAAAQALGPALEASAFGGNFKEWLFVNHDERYDPRNSLVVGFAMGFAVIPIIFTISEDAFSNVPAHLSAASLALGASRWQTALRVVVPTASPGVSSAVMIGFGRAVGETMIVLMATGNTPIMDWSIFNGMRTLSANIAVEIPEAPFGGTLYRILFLASAILFVLTFCVNTAAEIVRQRLRRKYEVL
jgi:phosphate transport system permease protein